MAQQGNEIYLNRRAGKGAWQDLANLGSLIPCSFMFSWVEKRVFLLLTPHFLSLSPPLSPSCSWHQPFLLRVHGVLAWSP